MLSHGDIPSVSLLITLESEGKEVTHRLAFLLGIGLDMQEYHDDADDQAKDDGDNADGECGERLDGEVEESSSKEEREVAMTEVKSTNTEDGSGDLNVNGLKNSKQAAEQSQWKALPLKADWFDVYIADVKDPDNFTVCKILWRL